MVNDDGYIVGVVDRDVDGYIMVNIGEDGATEPDDWGNFLMAQQSRDGAVDWSVDE